MRAIMAASLVLLFLAPAAQGEPARVLEVAAADTLRLSLTGRTVLLRLYGVDAPDPGQEGAEEAAAFTKGYITDQELDVTLLTKDNKGLDVGLVRKEGAAPLHEVLLKSGHAWWDRNNAGEDRELRRMNAQAIQEQKGLWRNPAALAPWDFRRAKGEEPVQYSLNKDGEEEAEAEQDSKPETLVVKGNATDRPNRQAPGRRPELRNGATINVAGIKVDHEFSPADIVRFRPRIAKDASGNVLGLTADNIGAIPGASQVGLRDGDIIQSVNGQRITSEADVLGLVQKHQNARQVDVTIVRGGNPMTVNVQLR